ncbi:MAG: hypothetical protein EOO07_34565 [Chitinophagaceae bacterium]|nr:MAG: hypothetical protein EOO07_34565 [Chitinophagaceae bacterium]
MLVRYYKKENVFLWIISQYGKYMRDIDVNWLLREYREHLPEIKLGHETASFLQSLKDISIPMGLITDGRSNTQRNSHKNYEQNYRDVVAWCLRLSFRIGKQRT